MIILSEAELEQIKESIKKEILNELPSVNEKAIPLEYAKKTWFYGEGGSIKFENSVMEKEFGRYRMHKVWEAVRTLTKEIFGKQYYQQLSDCDPEVCNIVCDKICETVIELRKLDEVQKCLSKNSK